MKVEYFDSWDEKPVITAPGNVLVTGLLEGEPVFVLRARDAIAMAVLNLYRSASEGLFDQERALSLEADVQAFIDWRQSPAGQAALRDPD